MNSYDIIGEAVKKYWNESHPQDVVVFFYQKYDFEDEWEWCEELVETYSSTDYEKMMFLYDFCEGQTCVKDIRIVPLDDVTRYYAKNVFGEPKD